MSTTSSTTKCKVFWPAPVCSGNGVCDESIGKCICKAGWTSIGDYALEEGVDCNINLTAVTALWSIDLICYLVCLLILIRSYYVRCFKSKAPIEWTEPSFQSPFFFTISVIGHVILASLRISSPGKRVIGGDVAMTTILIFGSTFATWTSLSFFQLNANFLQSTVKTMPERSRDVIIKRINIFNKGLPVAYALALIASIIPMFGLGYPQYIFWFSFAYHFILAVPINGFVLFGMNGILSPTMKEIESHIDSCKANNLAQDIEVFVNILKKLKVAKEQTNSCIIVTVLFLFIGCWPYINRNGSYVSPIMNIFGTLSLINVWILLNPTKSGSSSNDQNKNQHNRTVSTRVKDMNEIVAGAPTRPSSDADKNANVSSVHPSTGNN